MSKVLKADLRGFSRSFLGPVRKCVDAGSLLTAGCNSYQFSIVFPGDAFIYFPCRCLCFGFFELPPQISGQPYFLTIEIPNHCFFRTLANQTSIGSTYQIMYTRFFLRTGLHASQSRLTDERVFIPRVCEDMRRESGEREMREVASVEDGEEKRKRTAARNMVVIGRERRKERERCSWPEWKRLVCILLCWR